MAHTVRQPSEAEEKAKEKLQEKIRRVLNRSLQIREVDAGSCNGCEVEITGLNSPIYDAERLGIRFVASPRHADMLLVTGPVTRGMEIPLKKATTPHQNRASGGCRGLWLQWRHLRLQLCVARECRPGNSGRCLHPRLSTTATGIAAWYFTGSGPLARKTQNARVVELIDTSRG